MKWWEGLWRWALHVLVKAVTGVRREGAVLPAPHESPPTVFYANHQSHGDFLLIWVALSRAWRSKVRPVAAADYWLADALRRFIACRVFDMVLIDRKGNARHAIEQMQEALQAGSSLIIFPEGTRNSSEVRLPFKSGLYHLKQACPDAALRPVWIHNIQDVLPKGKYLPVPMLCRVIFADPLPELAADKTHFLSQARDALLRIKERI